MIVGNTIGILSRSLLIAPLILSSFHLSAQVEYLRLSPAQKIIQRVGATDVEINFSRPQMKERKVFGGLVPYGKMWRTGANENTTIAFNHRVKIGETEVEEGMYTLWTKPMKDNWEVYFYTETNLLDVPSPIDSAHLIYLTTVPSFALPKPQESLVINLYDVTEHHAILGISWESTGVEIPISFYTQEAMEKMIDKEFRQNAFDFSIAAAYYSQRDIELEKAKRLQELSIELREEPSAWAYHEYGKILMKLEEHDNAKKAFEYSLELAQKTDNEYMIKENEKVLSEMKNE